MTNYTKVAYRSTDVPETDEAPTPQEVIEQVDDLALEIERDRRHGDVERYMARTRSDFAAQLAESGWPTGGVMAGPVIERQRQEDE